MFPRGSGPAACDGKGTVPSTSSLVTDSGLGGFMSRFTSKGREQATAPPISELKEAPAASPTVPSPELMEPPRPADDPLSPVQFEQYAKEFLQLSSQDNFDGFRLEAGKPVTPFMQASHSMFLGTTLRDCGYMYQFGPSFGLEDGSMFLMGRYGNDGTMTVRGLRKLGKSLELRLSGSSSLESQQRNMLELSADHTGLDYALSVKSAWQGTWIFNSTYSQLVAPNLHMGGDLTWIAANGATTGSVGLRYAFKRGILSGVLSRQPNFKSPSGLTENVQSCKIQYFRKISDRLNLGTELELAQDPPSRESALRVGYEYLFRHARIQGLVDLGGKISMTAQNATGFGVSGTVDYWRGEYKFGFMMQVVPPVEAKPSGEASVASMQF